jgi:dCTP deaminase
MAFWSGEKLLEKLPDLIYPFHADQIDCASYALTIGHEVYISPTEDTTDAKAKTKQLLLDGQGFIIPPGQFGFLLTEESVTVPTDALAFISMKATIKFHGLVNVSGFHVDPGFMGQLTFAVFNAGPVPVHLQQGERCFLIWYATLDRNSKEVKKEAVRKGISSEHINSVSGGLQSLAGLSNRIKEVEHQQRTILSLALGIAVALVVMFLNFLRSSPAPVQVVFPQSIATTTAYAPTNHPGSATTAPSNALPKRPAFEPTH